MAPKRKRPAAQAASSGSAASATAEPDAQTRRATRQTAAGAPPLPTTRTPVPLPAPLLQRQQQVREAEPASSSPVQQQPPPPARRPLAPAPRPSSDLVAPEITYHVPQAAGARPASLVRPHGPPPVVTPVPPPKPPALSSHRGPPRADRNIDKVVLGNLCFRTWYPSHYGKEVLGDGGGGGGGGGNHGGGEAGKSSSSSSSSSKKEPLPQPMLERLYVCPSCFKYAKELVAWRGHVRLCERRGHVPGTKIYVHPRGRRKVLVAHDGCRAPGAKRRRGDAGLRYVEEMVQDQGEWSIWEVDGEKDGLFCQNLSLFAKLFLDNKSVFFDVTGFKYFLLVYTSPAAPGPEQAPPAPHEAQQQQQQQAPPPRRPPPQITGFFSKEKMSWDNNNLACILVFPPWQRKGLGALLMGASYEMSRREGIMGGPEKPISDLGKRGYRRFWSGEIARWLLALEVGGGAAAAETVVDVDDVSRGTWISPDDCLAVLRDMGVAEEAGLGPGKKLPLPPPPPPPPPSSSSSAEGSAAEEPLNEGEGGAKAAQAEEAPRPRVRLDKEAVRRFVAAHRISLDKACDAHGFVAAGGEA